MKKILVRWIQMHRLKMVRYPPGDLYNNRCWSLFKDDFYVGNIWEDEIL